MPNTPSSFPLTYRGTTYMNMVAVPEGSFLMSHKENDSVEITFEKPFYMAEFPVTQELYEAVMENNPAHFKGKKRPVEQVSWHDAQKFIEKLNAEKFPLGDKGAFRLPSEAEWEYAARGANKSNDFEFSGGENLDLLGWYDGNSNQETKPVGLKIPNELGIFDMSGNVWEWCEDWYNDYSKKPKNGDAFIETGANRVLRGGSWFYFARLCSTADRFNFTPEFSFNYIGFRLCSFLQSVG
jgi:formylglycine-generating enzyme